MSIGGLGTDVFAVFGTAAIGRHDENPVHIVELEAVDCEDAPR